MNGRKWSSLRWISALVIKRIRNTSVLEIMSSVNAPSSASSPMLPHRIPFI